MQTIFFLKAYHMVMTNCHWQWPSRRLTNRQRQRQRHTDTDKYKVLPRPNVYYIFQKDLRYYIGCLLMMTKTKTKTRFYALLGLNIFQGWIFSRSDFFISVYFSGVTIFQERIFFRGEHFSGVCALARPSTVSSHTFAGTQILFKLNIGSGSNLYQ